MTVEASDRLNPNAGGQSLTTQVQVLVLKSAAKLDNAEFSDLWQQAKVWFGEDLLQEQTVTVDPGSTTTTGFARDAKAAYLVVMGGFRQPSGTRWRSVFTLPPPAFSHCGPEPMVAPAVPGKDDADFHFLMEDFRVGPKAALAPVDLRRGPA